jgi:mitochondrial import inner membrane translocase subunit TIM22
MRYDTPLSMQTVPGQPNVPLTDLPLRQQLRAGLIDMRKTAVSSGRNFGKIGLLYAGTECCIEGLRAKNDMTNAVAAGAVTGAILARNQGPTAVVWSAVGFAAFSYGIELWIRSPEKERRYPVI